MVLFSVEIWGTVGQWFGAVGTSASVAAAAGYYIADQRRSSREQSRQVKMLLFGTNPTLRVKVHNHSDKPIYGVKAYSEMVSFSKMVARKDMWIYDLDEHLLGENEYESDADFMYRYWQSAPSLSKAIGNIGISDYLDPGNTVEFDFGERQHAAMDYWVEYTDARGQRWRIELGETKQKKVRGVKPFGTREPTFVRRITDSYYSQIWRAKAWWWWWSNRAEWDEGSPPDEPTRSDHLEA
ncbi:hypothetical protein ACIBG0_10515 [Nocardia sp. NPDC050630]|uniref:hypothetical protein n=1 Tax=Nocardia sp. NPDC050630 TaxID=3364321 RepID=UPI00379197F6